MAGAPILVLLSLGSPWSGVSECWGQGEGVWLGQRGLTTTGAPSRGGTPAWRVESQPAVPLLPDGEPCPSSILSTETLLSSLPTAHPHSLCTVGRRGGFSRFIYSESPGQWAVQGSLGGHEYVRETRRRLERGVCVLVNVRVVCVCLCLCLSL